MRPGCPERAERPGRLPKVFVQASHGSGAKKMAGLPNFGGVGEGREEWACCQPGPRLSTDPGCCRLGPHPQTFLGANFPVPATPAAVRWTRRARGIPSRRPEARGREAAVDAAYSAAATPSGQQRAKQRRPWRAAKARPASSEVPCAALYRGNGPVGAGPSIPPSPGCGPRRGEDTGTDQSPTAALAALPTGPGLGWQQKLRRWDTWGLPSYAHKQDLLVWGASRPGGPNYSLCQSESC